jgi:RNA polymerase sigma-70 factor (ECF subfamily)
MTSPPTNVFSNRSVERPDAVPSDEALVARCRSGDGQAFELLFTRYHQRVFRLAFQILRDRESALDAVQETFIRAYRFLDQYTGGGSFDRWLARITANLALDGIRSRRRKERVEPLGDAAELPEWPAPGPGPDEAAETLQLRHALERALEGLSPMHRVVLVLKEIEGLSCEEIAEALGCAVGTVMSRLHHARLKVKQRLDHWRNKG